MAERSLRGMSIGAKSLESDENVDFAPRREVAYICPNGHRTILPLADGAEVPDEWECRCGQIAVREGEDEEEIEQAHAGKPTRTHWDMLMERRSEEDLKVVLDKRLKMHREGWFPDYE
ncbi:RNA polymerase-binding protein RbpA [Bombiscardovia apis]|uniref:RNA polymerase-binding protein RbpA n=1 Tax=Bombiscardovia apis TaxID=2932182 RepID=A0ABM8BCK1_9BIFI|nr:RNA polymerase-binding protein RbpA [Bombiscardovia apis]BDR54642.1 RNA polymerase-binding protein RbpA [Bombiscardovia apis]